MPKIILLRKNQRIITLEQLQGLTDGLKKLGAMGKRTLDACDRNFRLYEHERELGLKRVELIKDLVKELLDGLCISDCVNASCEVTRETCIHFRKRQLIRRAQKVIANV